MLRKFALIITNVIYLFINVVVEGKENIPEGAFVLAGNHISNWDPIVVYKAIPERMIRFMAKKEIFKYKFFNYFLEKLGAFPVDRNANDIKAVKKGLSVLKNGEILGIFPQGTRCDNIDVNAVKPGYIMFADRCNVPIVPVAISGTYKPFSKVHIKFGKPYYITKEEKTLPAEKMMDVSVEVMTIIKKMVESV